MKRDDVKDQLKKISDEYVDIIRPLVEQAVANGAYFGSLHMDAANEVRTELAQKIIDSVEFSGQLYDKTGVYVMAEEEWTSQMQIMSTITLPNGDLWLPNFDAKSAREAFMAGVQFMQKVALERILHLLTDNPESI